MKKRSPFWSKNVNIFFPEEEHFASHRFEKMTCIMVPMIAVGLQKTLPPPVYQPVKPCSSFFFFFLHKYSSVLVSTAADETTS